MNVVSKAYVISHFNLSKIREHAYSFLSYKYYSHLATCTVYLLAYACFSFLSHLLVLVTHEGLQGRK